MMMVICTKSRIATENMPPNVVYVRTMMAPSTMPTDWLIAPSVTTLKTSPRALIWADTQPRYDATMQRVQRTSTVRLYRSR